jgi:phenylalanyl-tRNA synthetase alpha subunit
MKTILRIMVSIMLTYGLLTLTGCSTNNSRNDTAAVSEDFEDERSEVAEDLRELREDISEELRRVGERMENASEDSRQELSERNEELLQRRERVDVELERVETSTEKNWSEVREGARSTVRDVKREFNELGDRISD